MLDTAAPAWMADKHDLDTVDAKLTELANTQSALDVEIGEWLLAAERIELHVKFGYASVFEYAARKFGWDGRSTFERLRVARKLETLVALREELCAGRLTWSVVRENSRIAETPDVEAEWIEAVQGKTVREVERMVADHHKNARPTDKKDERAQRHSVHLSFTSEEYARFRESIESECKLTGEAMTQEQAVVSRLTRGDEELGTAANQLAFVRNVGSEATFVQTPAGVMPLAAPDAERIACDATLVPPTEDGQVVAKASQTIPPGIKRQVLVEARGCCEVPGCLKRYLEVHHKTFRSDGGTHELKFLVAICWYHHRRIHDGYLQLDGDRVSGWEWRHADGCPYGSPGTPQMQADVADAYHGLRRLGYKDPDARRAASAAASELVHDGMAMTGEAILKRALQRAGRGSAPATKTATAHVGTMVADAISGLRNLGYRERDARVAASSAVASLGGEPASAEAIVLAALKTRGGASIARESPAAYGGAAHVGTGASISCEPEPTYGSAHVGTEEFPPWLQDFLRRAFAGDRTITVPMRRPRVPA